MKIENNGVIWQNLANPSTKELDSLQNELGIFPSVLKELLGTNKRPKIEEYANHLFLVMHFPIFNEQTRQTVPTELDFIITSDSILTVYQNPNPILEEFFEELQNNAEARRRCFKSSGQLLFDILDKLIDSCLPMLDHINEKIENIERQMFAGKEKEMLREIAIVKRDIIDFRRTFKPQRSILELLAKKATRFFKDDLDIASQEAIGSEARVWNILENHKEMIEAIETTNSSLLSFQINRVMHTLTFFSIILFSLTFIASFFNMKVFEKQLLSDSPFLDLLYISGIMVLVILIISALFKRKKWM